MSTGTVRKDTGLTVVMIIAFVLVTVIWAASFLIMRGACGRPRDIGMAGDLFGAVGALFSGWAFAGVLWPILLQRRSPQIQLVAACILLLDRRKPRTEPQWVIP